MKELKHLYEAPDGKVHLCEGGHATPDGQNYLVWTKCEIDVPANESFEGIMEPTCQKCIMLQAEKLNRNRTLEHSIIELIIAYKEEMLNRVQGWVNDMKDGGFASDLNEFCYFDDYAHCPCERFFPELPCISVSHKMHGNKKVINLHYTRLLRCPCMVQPYYTKVVELVERRLKEWRKP